MNKNDNGKYDLGGVLAEVKKKMEEIKDIKVYPNKLDKKVEHKMEKVEDDDSYKSGSDDHDDSLDNNDHDDYDDHNDHNDQNDHDDDYKVLPEVKIVKEYKYLTVESIPTEGLTAEEILINQIKLGVKVNMCEACGKYFGENILVHVADMLQCYHCFFFMNFANENTINGQIGPTVIEYILLCQEQHKSPCSHLSDMGGCYICLYKTGCPIEGLELLDKDKIDNSDNESHCSIDDVCDTIIMNKGETVYI